jgi:hypothetical protein
MLFSLILLTMLFFQIYFEGYVIFFLKKKMYVCMQGNHCQVSISRKILLLYHVVSEIKFTIILC